jgi:hypothetical protein
VGAKSSQDPAGYVEIMAFDPKTASGEIKTVLVAENGTFLRVALDYREAGGVIRWDGDVRGVAMIDRYLARRKEIVALCPEGYPISDVVLILSSAAHARVARIHRENADRMMPYVHAHAEVLERIAVEQNGGAEDGRLRR